MKEILFCTTIDCDMSISSGVIRDKSLWALIEVLEKHNVSGHVTWFINENDFAITHSHSEFLKQVICNGDTIGVHDHVDFLGGQWRYDAIHDFCSKSLGSVCAWLGNHGYSRPVSHRFGCLFQHPEAYRVLVDLGYSISSDVCPNTRHLNHTEELSFDNTDVPIGILPYRHGPDTINDYQSNSGPMLQIPMIKATLTAKFWPSFDRTIVDSWLAGAENLGHEKAVLTLGFHPYEVVNKEKLKIDTAGISRLDEILTFMREEYSAVFTNLEECAARF